MTGQKALTTGLTGPKRHNIQINNVNRNLLSEFTLIRAFAQGSNLIEDQIRDSSLVITNVNTSSTVVEVIPR